MARDEGVNEDCVGRATFDSPQTAARNLGRKSSGRKIFECRVCKVWHITNTMSRRNVLRRAK